MRAFSLSFETEKVSSTVFLRVKIGRKHWVLPKKEHNVMYFEKK